MYKITIDMDKKFAECGKGGATGNGICMSCQLKAITGKKMKSKIGVAVQQRYESTIDNLRKPTPPPKG